MSGSFCLIFRIYLLYVTLKIQFLVVSLFHLFHWLCVLTLVSLIDFTVSHRMLVLLFLDNIVPIQLVFTFIAFSSIYPREHI